MKWGVTHLYININKYYVHLYKYKWGNHPEHEDKSNKSSKLLWSSEYSVPFTELNRNADESDMNHVGSPPGITSVSYTNSPI